MVKRLLLLLALVGLFAALPGRSEIKLPAGLKAEVVGKLDKPVGVAVAPDGAVYVIEQYTGGIHIYRPDKGLRPYAKTTEPPFRGHMEGGLIGIELRNNFVYVFYTVDETRQKVVRFRTQEDTGLEALTIVDRLPSMGINHNGGGIRFGPDGKLYLSVGDNGRASADAQNLQSLRGKILRYNEDGTVPLDNPFPGSPVWAMGFRNVYRFCFEPGTGRLLAGDNGPATHDEINIVQRGGNYGWPAALGPAQKPDFVDPIMTWTPTPAITGMTVVKKLAPLRGDILVGAFMNGALYRLRLDRPGGSTVAAHGVFAAFDQGVTDLAEAPDGSFWLTLYSGELVHVLPN